MGTKSFIAVRAASLPALAGSVAVYAYDSSNEDRVANGIRIARRAGRRPRRRRGARQKLRRKLAGAAREADRRRARQEALHPLRRGRGGEGRRRRHGRRGRGRGQPRRATSSAAPCATCTGGEEPAPDRAARDLLARRRWRKLVARVAQGRRTAPARDAKVNFPSLTEVKEQDGVKVRTRPGSSANVKAALTSPDDRTCRRAGHRRPSPRSRATQLAKKYPALIIVDRARSSCASTST